MAGRHFRRVGAVRPSHLMFTTGVGAIVDLPNFSVLVRGLDDWNHNAVPDWEPIAEPRLLAAVRKLLNDKSIKELRPAPWMDGGDEPNSPASKVGVPITPFPGWLRCTACDELAPIEGGVFGFENTKARKPHEARFFHTVCGRKKSGRRPMAVAARFVLVCSHGHLDDFPYTQFVHQGGACPDVSHPKLRMNDRGGNLGANVEIRCVPCGARRNMKEVLGPRGAQKLPRCRSRRAHLGDFESGGCKGELKLLVVGASNQWFAQTLSALAVPPTGVSELQAKVVQHWSTFEKMESVTFLPFARAAVPTLREFDRWTDEQIWAAVERHRAGLKGDDDESGYPDLHTPEWEIFSAAELPEASDDFTLRRDPDGVPAQLKEIYADVIQAERLREVRALVGFTRLDAPDPMDPDLVQRAPLARARLEWVPASEVRGEGIFLRLPEDLLADWEARVADTETMQTHREAYGRFRRSRYSGRIRGGFEPMRHWPGERFIALHTLSHLLIRTIALECGYSSASLSERIYSGTAEDPHRAGILIYTAVPDAEGTLGGLVSLAEPDALVRLTRRALNDALHCSSDPLCAERLPHEPAEFLHGAACHVCLFVSETTCERGNRFLDRRFVVPIDDPALALFPEMP
ncbi:DrmB family protein [Micromonospora sp. NPDC049903]|uniref:DrmB family protein n=1 Tax=Micromonospora sp. NPDC049903 TaxID=3364276 RepID=UPI00378B7CC8